MFSRRVLPLGRESYAIVAVILHITRGLAPAVASTIAISIAGIVAIITVVTVAIAIAVTVAAAVATAVVLVIVFFLLIFIFVVLVASGSFSPSFIATVALIPAHLLITRRWNCAS